MQRGGCRTLVSRHNDAGSEALMPDELLVVAKIGAPYGIKGWVKLHSFLQQPLDLEQYTGLVAYAGNVSKVIEFAEIKSHGKGLIAQIVGVDNRTQAETFKNLELKLSTATLPDLDDGDYYWHQLQGLAVYSDSEEGIEPTLLLGRIASVMETGANDVLVLEPCENSVDDKERLIPYLPERVIKKVDLANKRMLVDWGIDF